MAPELLARLRKELLSLVVLLSAPLLMAPEMSTTPGTEPH